MLQAVRRLFSSSPAPYNPAWVKELDIQFTPDLWKLERKALWNIFIYGELMPGCSKFERHMLGRAHELAKAYTVDQTYVMWKKKLGLETRPFILPVEANQLCGNGDSYIGRPAKVQGYLFTVRPQQIVRLDNHYLNGVEFERKRISVSIPYRQIVDDHGKKACSTPISQVVRCFAYEGRPDFWLDQFDPKHDRFDTCKLYTANHGREDLRSQYYFYFEQYEQTRRK